MSARRQGAAPSGTSVAFEGSGAFAIPGPSLAAAASAAPSVASVVGVVPWRLIDVVLRDSRLALRLWEEGMGGSISKGEGEIQ